MIAIRLWATNGIEQSFKQRLRVSSFSASSMAISVILVIDSVEKRNERSKKI
jgi:hypothetical protein